MNQWKGIQQKYFSKSGIRKRKKSLGNQKKRVGQYSADGELLCEFESVSSASHELNISMSSISASARTRNKLRSGFSFRFLD